MIYISQSSIHHDQVWPHDEVGVEPFGSACKVSYKILREPDCKTTKGI